MHIVWYNRADYDVYVKIGTYLIIPSYLGLFDTS